MTKKTTRKIGDITISEEIVAGKKSGKWKIDIPVGLVGNPRRKMLRFSSRTSAENEARRIIKQVQVGNALIQEAHTGFTLRDVFDQWLDREKIKIASGRKKQLSLETDLNCLASVLEFFDDYDLAEITKERIEEYQAHRKQAGRAETKINTECRKLKAMMNWCFSMQLLERVPIFDPLDEPPLEFEVPNTEEMILILKEMPNQVGIFFRLMVETGLHVSEARRLRWENIDLERCSIRITHDGKLTPKTKYSYRTVRFGVGLQAGLQGLKGIADWVFPSRK